jgi:hypothetical protein
MLIPAQELKPTAGAVAKDKSTTLLPGIIK